MDGGDSGAGRELEGTQPRLGAERTERLEGEPQAEVLTSSSSPPHPIVEKDGIKFYEITRYGHNRTYLDYQPVESPQTGNGTRTFADPVVQAKAQLTRAQSGQVKAQRADEYEAKVFGLLDNVASLQQRILNAALDSSTELDRAEMEKLRLGLAAGESILNRALGKAVTKVDMDVTHNTADEIALTEAEWVEEVDDS